MNSKAFLLTLGDAEWFETLPESLRETATGEALQAIAEMDLDALAEITPSRGYGRD